MEAEKKKKKKKSKKPAKGLSGLSGWLSPQNTQGSWGQSAKQGGLEIVSGLAGALLSAFAGSKVGFASGAILIIGGNYYDKTGLAKAAGVGAMAYSIAKAIKEGIGEVNGLGEPKTGKDRLKDFKDELMVSFYLDKLFKKKVDSGTSVSGLNDDQFGEADLAALDMFDDYNEQQASNFAQESQMFGDFPMDFAYSVIDE